jgi:predicted small secreted protein
LKSDILQTVIAFVVGLALGALFIFVYLNLTGAIAIVRSNTLKQAEAAGKAYRNTETYEVQRDSETGRIIGLIIHRDAKEGSI